MKCPLCNTEMEIFIMKFDGNDWYDYRCKDNCCPTNQGYPSKEKLKEEWEKYRIKNNEVKNED